MVGAVQQALMSYYLSLFKHQSFPFGSPVLFTQEKLRFRTSIKVVGQNSSLKNRKLAPSETVTFSHLLALLQSNA